MVRFLSSVWLALMLLAGPALCLGGLLEHACDCGEGGIEMQCQHEDSCSGDPCKSLTVTQGRDSRGLFDFGAPWVPVTNRSLGGELASAQESWSKGPPDPSWRWNLPYAQSDRPLRI